MKPSLTKHALFTVMGCLVAFTTSSANAAIIVTPTTTAFFDYDASVNNNPSNQAAGLTMNVTFTPDAAAIAQADNAMALLQIGGAANGAGIYLLGGQIYFRVKMNSANANDTSTYPDLDQSAANKMVGIRSSDISGVANGGLLTAGIEYTVTAIFDPSPSNTEGSITLALQATGGSLFSQTFSITTTTGNQNWNGNNTKGTFMAAGGSQVGGGNYNERQSLPRRPI